MKNLLKRLLLITLSLALVATFTSCGKKTKKDIVEADKPVPVSDAFHTNSLWFYVNDDEYYVDKDTEIKAAYLFDGEGNVTIYKADRISFKELKDLSEEDILELIKQKDKDVFIKQEKTPIMMKDTSETFQETFFYKENDVTKDKIAPNLEDILNIIDDGYAFTYNAYKSAKDANAMTEDDFNSFTIDDLQLFYTNVLGGSLTDEKLAELTNSIEQNMNDDMNPDDYFSKEALTKTKEYLTEVVTNEIEAIKKKKLSSYVEPQKIKFELLLTTDGTGNNTKDETLFIDFPEEDKYDIKIELANLYSTFNIYDKYLGGYNAFVTFVNEGHIGFTLDKPDTEGIRVDE